MPQKSPFPINVLTHCVPKAQGLKSSANNALNEIEWKRVQALDFVPVTSYGRPSRAGLCPQIISAIIFLLSLINGFQTEAQRRIMTRAVLKRVIHTEIEYTTVFIYTFAKRNSVLTGECDVLEAKRSAI